MSAQSSTDSNTVEPKLRASSWTYQFLAVFHSDRNMIEIPRVYHKQGAPDYPPKVLFQYNGNTWIITVRKVRNKYFFADRLKEFRRTLGIHEAITITFAGCERVWEFYLDIPPLEEQSCGRPPATHRTHVWTVELSEALLSGSVPLVFPQHALFFLGATRGSMRILGDHSEVMNWNLVIHDRKKGSRAVGNQFNQFCAQKNLVPGDEVCFYYRPKQKVWEIVIRQEIVY